MRVVFITAAESALTAAAIVSAGSVGVAVANRKASREHRIWERKCDIYEDILRYVTGWADYRGERAYHNGPSVVEPPAPRPKREVYVPLDIRLTMFGSPSVQRAFRDCFDRELEWSGLQVRLSSLREERDHVTRGMLAPGTGPGADEINRAKVRINEVFAAADEARVCLTELISDEVHLRRRDPFSFLKSRPRRQRTVAELYETATTIE